MSNGRPPPPELGDDPELRPAAAAAGDIAVHMRDRAGEANTIQTGRLLIEWRFTRSELQVCVAWRGEWVLSLHMPDCNDVKMDRWLIVPMGDGDRAPWIEAVIAAAASCRDGRASLAPPRSVH